MVRTLLYARDFVQGLEKSSKTSKLESFLDDKSILVIGRLNEAPALSSEINLQYTVHRSLG